MFLRIGPFHRMPIAARREVKAILVERTGCLPFNSGTLALARGGYTSVFTRRRHHEVMTLAMGLSPIAPQQRVPSLVPSGIAIAASAV